MINNLIWALLAMNAGIALVFAWGLLSQPEADRWRTMVRDWVGSKALWMGALAAYWALNWIGFTESAPRPAQLVYAAVLVGFTVFHARAAANWMLGQAVSPRADSDWVRGTAVAKEVEER